MDLMLTLASLSSFFVLIVAWVALPNTMEDAVKAEPATNAIPAAAAIS